MTMPRRYVQTTQEEQRGHPERLVVPIAPTGADDRHELGIHPFLGSARDEVSTVTDAGFMSLWKVLFPNKQGLAQSRQIPTPLLDQRPHLILADIMERLVGVGDDVASIDRGRPTIPRRSTISAS